VRELHPGQLLLASPVTVTDDPGNDITIAPRSGDLALTDYTPATVHQVLRNGNEWQASDCKFIWTLAGDGDLVRMLWTGKGLWDDAHVGGAAGENPRTQSYADPVYDDVSYPLVNKRVTLTSPHGTAVGISSWSLDPGWSFPADRTDRSKARGMGIPAIIFGEYALLQVTLGLQNEGDYSVYEDFLDDTEGVYSLVVSDGTDNQLTINLPQGSLGDVVESEVEGMSAVTLDIWGAATEAGNDQFNIVII